MATWISIGDDIYNLVKAFYTENIFFHRIKKTNILSLYSLKENFLNPSYKIIAKSVLLKYSIYLLELITPIMLLLKGTE